MVHCMPAFSLDLKSIVYCSEYACMFVIVRVFAFADECMFEHMFPESVCVCNMERGKVLFILVE